MLKHTQIAQQDRINLQSILGHEVVSVDIPGTDNEKEGLSIQNVTALRLTLREGPTTSFAAKSVDLVEGVEVFVVEIPSLLDLRRYPGGPQVDWHPSAMLVGALGGTTISDVRILTAGWRIILGGTQEASYYGNNPRSLAYDLLADTDSHDVEDGLMLLCSNRHALVISTASELSGTLKVWCTEL